MAKLKDIVERSDIRLGRAFDLSIQGLIVLSLVSFSIETLPDLSPTSRWTLRWIEVVTVAIFTVEYALRVLLADRKLGFVCSFFGLIDLLAILPFYVSTGVDLRSLRLFRLLRLFHLFKLFRYSNAIWRIRRALTMAKEELVLFSVVTGMLLYVSALGIYHFEHQAQPEVFRSVFDSLWWAVVTLTTVGYGDAYPITVGGRIFTCFVLLLGLGVVAVPTGIFASALSAAREHSDDFDD